MCQFIEYYAIITVYRVVNNRLFSWSYAAFLGIDNIASDATLNGRILSYSIYNVDGSLVANGDADASVDTQNLQPGVYVLKARTDKGCVTKKIMKR